MEFKIKKTYEIIDYQPKVLITNIPIIDIISLSIYYIGTPFYLIYRKLKNNEPFNNFFRKKTSDVFKGGETRYSISSDLNDNQIDIDTSSVLNTEIYYHYDNKAYLILKELICSGSNIKMDVLSKKFFIKERIEFYDINSSVNNETEVIFSYPEFAAKIAKILHLKKQETL